MSSRISWQEIVQQEQSEKSGKLEIDGYGLTTLPFEIREMTWLKELNLNGNGLQQIEGLDKLVELEKLYLAENLIKKIDGLAQLQQLQVLSLQSNQIEQIEGLETLKHLDILSLRNNQVKVIQEIESLQRIRMIDLSNNQIESIREILPMIQQGYEVIVDGFPDQPGLSFISLERNPIAEPPFEIIQQGRDAILKYFEERNVMSTRKLEILKVILVGNSQVGKSNFSQFLRESKIQPDTKSTHILDIQKWDADFLVSEQGVKTRLHLFDFGGQDYYHDAHRMYYSHDTAYILLWDTISNEYQELEEQIDELKDAILYENFPLPYWLQSINYTLAGRYVDTYGKPDTLQQQEKSEQEISSHAPPILVIQNKIDIENGKLNQEELSKQYPNIWGYFGVSLLKSKRTDVLKELLSDYLQSLNLTGRLLLDYQYKIVAHFSDNVIQQLDIYSLNEFKQICIDIVQDNNVVFEDRDALIIAHILNNIGLVLLYESADQGAFIFSDIHLLNEQIKKIMSYAKMGHTKGVFRKQDVLDDLEISNEDKILELLCGNKSMIELSDTLYLAPQFLPTEPDRSIKFFLHTFNHLQMRFVYPAYYHKSILLNLFANYLNDIKDSISLTAESFPFWRNGIIVSKGQGEQKEMVFIEFVKNKQHAIINLKTMRPFSNQNLEGEIERLIDTLNKGWNVTKEVSVDGTTFIQTQKLIEKYVTKQFEFVRDNKRYRINDFKDLVELKDRPKRIFISYSSLDKEYLKQLTTQIVSLRNEGIVETWDDRELQAGDKWDIIIKEQLDKADYVLLLITANFLNSEYIREVELKKALNQQKKIIPIIIDYCTWNFDEAIQEIQVLNKEAPLTSYQPISKGWVEVIKVLRELLKK